MSDTELLEAVEKYLTDNNITLTEFFNMMGMSIANFSRWKSGRSISAKARRKLIAMILPSMVAVAPSPASPPTDRLLQYIMESWETLSSETKGRIITLVDEDKKDTASKVG